MKAFVALLCVAAAAAEPIWYSGLMHPTMYHGMPIQTIQTIKPEEYTKTMEYKTGMPTIYKGLLGWNNWYPYSKVVDMPEIEKDYASKGEYRAEAAGGVVHVAKREAEPFWPYNAHTWSPYTNAWAHPISAYHGFPYMMPIMPKMVQDDRLKADTPEYANKGKYVAESAGVVHLAKREAEPFWPINAHTWTPYTNTWAAPISAYTHYPYYMPIMPKMVQDDRLKADTPEYANKGEYRAESAGVVHLAKRDADAALLYRSPIIPSIYNYNSGIYGTRYINTVPSIYRANYINAYNRFFL